MQFIIVFRHIISGETLGVPIHVYGPETHMTAIVGMALGKRKIAAAGPQRQNTTANFLLPGGQVRLLLYTTLHMYNSHKNVKI